MCRVGINILKFDYSFCRALVAALHCGPKISYQVPVKPPAAGTLFNRLGSSVFVPTFF